jgi:predicted nucleic acid-binding protein
MTRPGVSVSSPPVAFLDSSALVKLIAVEAETAALRRELVRWPHRVSSFLAAVEVTRTARRLGPHAIPLAARVLGGLDLLSIDAVVPAAMHIGSNLLRSLDAIHLATAASITADLGALLTYDRRMLADAQAMGLPVLSPR